MPKIKITNPRNVIEAPIKKNYFKIRATSGPKGDKGDTGATGPQGPQGPQGNAATIYVGSTTTLPVGQDATVENVGSQYAAVLNFGIPQGPQGPQGAKGDKGDKGDKGEQGNTGNTGPAGQNATVYIGTTTTGAPGSQASVYNSGTENNAVLNFTIPRGQKGDTGATGPQGPAGQDGKDFAPSVVDSLPAVGEESKLYLTPKAHTTQTATGNPITATVTDDAGQIEDFQLDGDTYQQSYSGKNLFDKDNANVLVAYIDPQHTVITANAQNRIIWIPCEPNTTYTVSRQRTSDGQKQIAYTAQEPAAGVQIYGMINWNASLTERTITTGADARYLIVRIWQENQDRDISLDDLLKLVQIEIGSTATPYEPYVGGIASPNPTYPQPIQVVTGEQTVSKVGKNLFDKDKALDNYFYTSTGSKSTYSKAQFCNQEFRATSNEITMSFSGAHDRQSGSNIEANVRIVQYDASGNFISRLMSRTNGYTFTLDANTKSFILSVDNGPDAWFDDLQVEYGSTATAYSPYSKQTLHINLGSIELCKLGTYQDYIWKDGDTWKVHKATGKVALSSIRWYVYAYTLKRTDINPIADMLYVQNNQQVGVGLTEGFQIRQGAGLSSAEWLGYFAIDTNRIAFNVGSGGNDPSGNLYYAKATATDTTITDATLISQLNAIASASLENGSNTVTNTATGSNLAGDMEVDYFGYDPTNRYDKWLWLDINNAYEKLGS